MEADEYARQWLQDIHRIDQRRERSLQTESRTVGVSDIGGCRNRLRLFMSGEPFSDSTTIMPAVMGTAAHEFLLPRLGELYPHLLIEQEVHVTLPSGLVIKGHADVIDPTEPSVTDLKSKDGVQFIKRNGSSDQERLQRGLYAVAAIQEGLIPAEGVITRNVYIDRSGRSEEVVVQQELLDVEWVLNTADAWVKDVTYALMHSEEAPKDVDYGRCASYCPFFTACRGDETPPAQLSAPETWEAAETYSIAATNVKVWGQVQDEARQRLVGLEGVTPTHRVKWLSVGATKNRAGYDRLDVRSLG